MRLTVFLHISLSLSLSFSLCHSVPLRLSLTRSLWLMTKLLDIHFADDLHSVCLSTTQIKTFIYRLPWKTKKKQKKKIETPRTEVKTTKNLASKQTNNPRRWKRNGVIFILLFARQTSILHYFEIQINRNVVGKYCRVLFYFFVFFFSLIYFLCDFFYDSNGCQFYAINVYAWD